MKKAIKLIFVAALIVLMMVTMIGCGEEPVNPDNPDNPSGPTAAPGEATPTPNPDNPGTVGGNFTNPDEEYTFTSWQFKTNNPYSGDDERSQAMRERIKDIQDKYSIKITFLANGEVSSSVMLQSAFQGAPEVTGMKEGGLHTMMDTYLYQNVIGKCLVPLSDHSDVYDFKNEAKFNVYSQYDLCEYNNKLWFFIPQEIGVHFECAGNCLVFNKNLLKAAGYDESTIYGWVDNGEWNWDNFEKVLQATTDPTKGQWGIERGNEALVIWSLANGNGTEFVSNEQNPATGQLSDTFVVSGEKGDRLMEAYDEFYALAKTLNVMEPTYYSSTDPAPLNHFLEGNVAFFYNGYSTNPLVANNAFNDKTISSAEFDYGLIPWPMGDTAAKNNEGYHSFFPHLNPYCVFRDNTGNVKGAVQILCELFTPIYDMDSDEAAALYKTEKGLACRDEKSQEYLDIVENKKVHFRVFMYSKSPVSIEGATTLSGALFGKGEDAILNNEHGALEYFKGIYSAVNQGIKMRSPYSWK